MITAAETERRKSAIAAIVPLALLALFYMWIGMIRMFVGNPPNIDDLPPWLKRLDLVAGGPLLFLIPPGSFLAVLVCLVLLPFRRWRGPTAAFLLSSAAVYLFLVWVDPGEWFRWFMD